MNNSSPQELPEIRLGGVKVWLSGAVPEPQYESPDISRAFEVWSGSFQEQSILGFVQEFSSLVFKFGGTLIHGCHPSLTPILLEQAGKFQGSTQEKHLKLAVSDYFEKGNAQDWKRWTSKAELEIVPKTGEGKNDLDPSLSVLRKRMAKQCNAFVVIGGLWWKDVPGRAGIPKEFELAKEQGVPCFVLGGFGGALASYIKDNKAWSKGLNNGLDEKENLRLAKEKDFVLVAGRLVAHLANLADTEGKS